MVRGPNLTADQRVRLKDFLLERCVNGHLQRGALSEAAIFFSVGISSISRLWKKWCDAHTRALNGSWDVTSSKTTNSRPFKYDRDNFTIAVLEVPLSERRTVRNLAENIGVSAGFVQALKMEGGLNSHSSPLWPTLNEVNKLARVGYCLDERGRKRFV